MTDSKPVIVSFVSGKGGVGKTMLSVAFAREMSVGSRTLIFDLDFFNRGLTGLMRHGRKVKEIEKPTFLKGADAAATHVLWSVMEVAPNLFFVAYPDWSDEQIRELETSDVHMVAAQFKAFLTLAATETRCSVIVLDCHGGPDHLSFAACLFSDYALLVSEPDRITFYGTLHFLKQLDSLAEQRERASLRLIFNKVIPAFSVRFLTRFYNTELRSQFSNHPLLAVFPLEVYLTKEFEKTPFLTFAYPYSLLAIKTRIMISDLLLKDQSDLLPRSARLLPALVKIYGRAALGKQSKLLNPDTVLKMIGLAAIALILVSGIASNKEAAAWVPRSLWNLLGWLDQTVSAVGLYLAGMGCVWYFCVLLLSWTSEIDTSFTYAIRLHKWPKAFLMYLIALALWFPGPFVLRGWVRDVNLFWWMPLSSFLIALGIAVFYEALKCYLAFRSEASYVEGGLRLVFLGYLATVIAMSPQT